MTRIVRDVPGRRVTTPADSSVVDSYARPGYTVDDRLGDLSRSLVKWAPTLAAYTKKERDKNYDLDVAIGQKIAADNPDLDLSDLEHKAASGDLDTFKQGLRNLTLGMKNGIAVTRHAAAANRITTAMNEWWTTGTYQTTDSQGNTVNRPLGEIADPELFDNLFEREYNAKLNQITGGNYDFELFQEFMAGRKQEILGQLRQKYTSLRYEAYQEEQLRASTELVRTIVDPLLVNGRYQDEPKNRKAIADQINAEITRLTQTGISRGTAAQWAAEYLIGTLQDYTIDGIEGLAAVTDLVPELKGDMKLTGRIIDSACRAQVQLQQDRRARRMEAQAAEYERNKAISIKAARLSGGDMRLYYHNFLKFGGKMDGQDILNMDRLANDAFATPNDFNRARAVNISKPYSAEEKTSLLNGTHPAFKGIHFTGEQVARFDDETLSKTGVDIPGMIKETVSRLTPAITARYGGDLAAAGTAIETLKSSLTDAALYNANKFFDSKTLLFDRPGYDSAMASYVDLLVRTPEDKNNVLSSSGGPSSIQGAQKQQGQWRTYLDTAQKTYSDAVARLAASDLPKAGQLTWLVNNGGKIDPSSADWNSLREALKKVGVTAPLEDILQEAVYLNRYKKGVTGHR